MLRPYYEDNSVKIYHGDACEILPQIDVVDVSVTDIPYSEQTHAGARGDGHLGGDTVLIDFAPWTADYARELFDIAPVKRWLIAFMDWRHLAQLEICAPASKRFVRFGVWHKPNGMPQFSGDRPATGWEAIGIFHSREAGRMHWNGGGHRAVWTHPKIAGDHPSEKPLSLIKQLIKQFSDPGETVLDFCCGSGTTLRAAKDLGRKAIGIEISEEYCEQAARRMSQEVFAFA